METNLPPTETQTPQSEKITLDTERIEAERNRIYLALVGDELSVKQHDALYAAQQALSWALGPEIAAAPYGVVMRGGEPRYKGDQPCRPPQDLATDETPAQPAEQEATATDEQADDAENTVILPAGTVLNLNGYRVDLVDAAAVVSADVKKIGAAAAIAHRSDMPSSHVQPDRFEGRGRSRPFSGEEFRWRCLTGQNGEEAKAEILGQLQREAQTRARFERIVPEWALNAIRRDVEERRREWAEQNPGAEMPADDTAQTLVLVDEIENLKGLLKEFVPYYEQGLD